MNSMFHHVFIWLNQKSNTKYYVWLPHGFINEMNSIWLKWLAYASPTARLPSFLPLTIYCTLSVVCLLAGTSIFPDDMSYDAGVLIVLLLSLVAASMELELRWSSMSLRAWRKD